MHRPCGTTLAALLSVLALAAAPRAAGAATALVASFGSFGGVAGGSADTLLGGSSANVTAGRAGGTALDLAAGYVGATTDPRFTASFTTPASHHFAMIAVPLAGSTGNALGSLFDELGSSDPARWRVGHWQPAAGNYAELQPTDAMPIGQGFWIVTGAATALSYTGLPRPAQQQAIALLDSANAGAWNQLGNPFPFDVAVSAVTVNGNGTSYGLLSTNPLAENAVYVWDASTQTHRALTGTNTLPAYGGFWVKRKAGTGAGTTVNVLVPPAAAPPNAQQERARPVGTSWAVRVNATQDGHACTPLLLGAGDVPVTGRNALCRPAAPASPAGGLRLVAHHDDWLGASGDYAADVRAAAPVLEFAFTLAADRAPGEIALEFDADGLLPNASLRLTDAVTGETRDVTPGVPVTVMATAPARTYRLAVSAPGGVAPAASPPADRLREAYPNPFAHETGVAFSLSRGGDAAIDVLDLAGRRVAGADLHALGAGDHVWVWNGRGADGAAQPPGVYLVRWRSGAARGVRRLVKIHP